MSTYIYNEDGTLNQDLEKSVVVLIDLTTHDKNLAYLENITEDNRFIFRVENKPHPIILGLGAVDPDSPYQKYTIMTVESLRTGYVYSKKSYYEDHLKGID